MSKRKIKRLFTNKYKQQADTDLQLALAVTNLQRAFLTAISTAQNAGLRVDCGRDVAATISIYRPIIKIIDEVEDD